MSQSQSSRIPSPARSQGDPASPRRYQSRLRRKTRSVGSPARSTASGRLSSVIQFQEKNMDSFHLSPVPTRRSVLNDDTDVLEETTTRRKSWWKKLSNHSRDIMEVLDENKIFETNEAVEEYIDIEVLSQEKKNYTLDLPESSDSESISSIVIPQRKLFTQKENQPQKKFGRLVGTRESLAKLNKTGGHDKTVKVAPKNLFNRASRANSKPVFPADLLNISPNKTVNKTKDMAAAEVKGQVRTLFGNRAGTKRKNMFTDFIVSESEDEISEIQPRVFGFQKKSNLPPESSNSQKRVPSPTSSITTDNEMDDWKLLPSSTMVENQLEDMIASDKIPIKKPRLSMLSVLKESSTIQTANTSNNKSKQSNEVKSVNSSQATTQNKSQNLSKQSNKVKSVNSSQVTTQNKSQNLSKQSNNVKSVNSSKATIQNKSPNLQEPYKNDPEVEHDNESQPEIQNDSDMEDNDDTQKEEEENNEVVEENENDNSHKKSNGKLNETQEQDEELDNDLELHRVNDNEVENVPEESEDDDDIQQTYEESDKEEQIENQGANQEEQGQSEEDMMASDKIPIKQPRFSMLSVTKEPGAIQTINTSNNKSKQSNEVKSVNSSRATTQNKSQNLSKQSNKDKSVNSSKATTQNKSQNLKELNKNDPEVEHDNESQPEIQNDSDMEDYDDIQKEEEDNNEVEEENENDNSHEKSNGELNDTRKQDEELGNDLELHKENDNEVENVPEESEDDEDIQLTYEDSDKEEQIENQEADQEEKEQSEDEQEASEVENEEEQEASEVEKEEQSEDEQQESEVEQEVSQEMVESSSEIEDTNEGNNDDDNMPNAETDDSENNDDENDAEGTETPNVSHDTTGRNRKKDSSKVKSPEAVLNDNTKQMESFMAKGRNTSLRRTSIMKSMNLRTSLAPPGENTGLSDGTKNSSAEGSGWDSHRTTRKTLRQTFGRDFSPRKSLRALVMEKSAKRQTAVTNLTSVNPQANSTELPSSFNDEEIDLPAESNHDVSKQTRQATLELYLQKIKQQNLEKKIKLEEAIRNSLKAPRKDTWNLFKVPTRPPIAARKTTKQAQNKPKAKPVKSNFICFDDLPPEVKEDMKYKPPKRFQPRNAAWATKRLYKFLEDKLEPKYDYKARIRAEKLVQSIYNFCTDLRKQDVASPDAVDVLKHEMARLNIVTTHFEFYQFFFDFMPRNIRIKVIPDIVNKIPAPRHGVFSEILRGNTIQE